MNIKTCKYADYNQQIPQNGQHILAYQNENELVVYQAYNDKIVDFAVKNQFFGGEHYSYNRMSWIKPNFLWMMYRCGWAEKQNQERVLALWIDKNDFNNILEQAVITTFNPKYHENEDHWKAELKSKDVRLQWDPDHDPFGNKTIRRALQLGLKDTTLERFGKKQIKRIEDVTPFVKEQKANLDKFGLEGLYVPQEEIYQLEDINLKHKIGIE